jgi:hypothetical protein
MFEGSRTEFGEELSEVILNAARRCQGWGHVRVNPGVRVLALTDAGRSVQR